MKLNLDKYYLATRILTGGHLKLIFENRYEMDEKRVLELSGIAGYIDTTSGMPDIKFLVIGEAGSAYAIDLSVRLDMPDVAMYTEVFLYTDADCISFGFHAIAEQVQFRYFEDRDGRYK